MQSERLQCNRFIPSLCKPYWGVLEWGSGDRQGRDTRHGSRGRSVRRSFVAPSGITELILNRTSQVFCPFACLAGSVQSNMLIGKGESIGIISKLLDTRYLTNAVLGSPIRWREGQATMQGTQRSASGNARDARQDTHIGLDDPRSDNTPQTTCVTRYRFHCLGVPY
jgi:hypothetical protein